MPQRPFLGVRACRSDETGTLRSIWRDYDVPWPRPPQMTAAARCLPNSPSPMIGSVVPRPHDPTIAPYFACTCGYYATWAWGDKGLQALAKATVAPNFAVIAVAGYGTTVKHEWGFRAQRMRVLAVLASHMRPVSHPEMDGPLASCVAQAYGVPIVDQDGLKLLAQEWDLEAAPWRLADQ